MYAFTKMSKLDRSFGGGGRPLENRKFHVPNEALLLTLDSNTMDTLNIEEWLSYWRHHILEAVRSNILYPKLSSPLVKSATEDLKWQRTVQSNKLRQLNLIDPHTLDSANPSPPTKSGMISSKFLAASNKTEIQPREKQLVIKIAGKVRCRKPVEEIQLLYTHVAAISTNCAQAYNKCKNLTSTSSPQHGNCHSELQPDTLLLNVLAHQIGGLDVSLSASMGQSCQLFLEGIREITDTIDLVCDVRHAFYKPMSEADTAAYRSDTLSVIRLLDKVNTMIAFNSDLKYYFIKLQMEALLVVSWPPGSNFFTNSINSLRQTIENLMNILQKTPDLLVSIDWEKEDEFLRDQYFTIMEKYYYAKRRFSNQYNSAFLTKLNYHADWLKFLHEKFSQSSKPAPPDEHDSCSTNFNISQPKTSSATADVRYRRYRDSKDLIIDLTNHLLHINNSRTKFIRLSMIKDLSEESHPNKQIPKLSTVESCQILVKILRHQIAGLDIALSSEIFNSIKCFLHGLYDTSCSIMNIMSDKYYDQKTHEHLPLSSGIYTNAGALHSGDGDQPGKGSATETRVHQIEQTLRKSEEIIRQKKPKWKHILLKLQLEALLLTQCSADTHIFRQYLEIMAGTAENAYQMLNEHWFIPYLSVSWDDASSDDQHVFYSYWELLEACLIEEKVS